MYYTENNHNKVVLRDFYLSRFENGPITEPCGTPEYLGTALSIYHYLVLLFTCCFYMFVFVLYIYIYITLLLNVSPSLICFHVLPLASPHAVKIGLRAYFTFLSCLLPSAFEDHNLSEVNCYSEKPSETELKALLLLLPLFLSFHVF